MIINNSTVYIKKKTYLNFGFGKNFMVSDITLTSAQVKTLFSIPTQLIANPGVNKVINIHNVFTYYNFGTIAYTLGAAVAVKFSTAASGMTPGCPSLADMQGLVDVIKFSSAQNPTAIQVVRNDSVVASATIADYATGDGTLRFRIIYEIISL